MTKKNVFQNMTKSAALSRIPALKEENAALFEEDIVTHSARVPKSLNREVKRLATDEDTSLQELTIEALRLLLASRGLGSS